MVEMKREGMGQDVWERDMDEAGKGELGKGMENFLQFLYIPTSHQMSAIYAIYITHLPVGTPTLFQRWKRVEIKSRRRST